MEIEFYCKVYVNLEVELDGIKAVMSDIFNAKFEGRTICYGILAIDLFKNKDTSSYSASVDRAVYWPYYLEVEPIDDASIHADEFVGAIATLLERFRTIGIQVVPSCDFEERLVAVD